MKITWNGHSCFKLESACGSVVLDPYADGSVPGLRPLQLEADAVLCSHEHSDHAYKQAVKLSGKTAGFQITAIEGYHDDARGLLRGNNTMHIISDGEIKIAHLGDIGCELSAEQLKAMQGLDAVLIPVGGFFTINAKVADRICRQLSARVVIPMHYRSDSFGFDVIAKLDRFTSLRDDVIYYDTNSFELNADTPRQTAVLKYL